MSSLLVFFIAAFCFVTSFFCFAGERQRPPPLANLFCGMMLFFYSAMTMIIIASSWGQEEPSLA